MYIILTIIVLLVVLWFISNSYEGYGPQSDDYYSPLNPYYNRMPWNHQVYDCDNQNPYGYNKRYKPYPYWAPFD